MSVMANERSLLARAREFDQEALVEVYDLYSPAIYRYAIRLLDDQALAEDCVTDTFGRLLDALKAGGGPTNYLKAYLYRMAHNWITDHHRSATRHSISLDDLDEQAEAEAIHSDDLDPSLHLVSSRIDAQHVRKALLRLTEDQRQVVVLRFYENLSNEEVAAVINKPVGAVKALQHRALAALRRALVHVVEVEVP